MRRRRFFAAAIVLVTLLAYSLDAVSITIRKKKRPIKEPVGIREPAAFRGALSNAHAKNKITTYGAIGSESYVKK
jgi:hypothetical protein